MPWSTIHSDFYVPYRVKFKLLSVCKNVQIFSVCDLFDSPYNICVSLICGLKVAHISALTCCTKMEDCWGWCLWQSFPCVWSQHKQLLLNVTTILLLNQDETQQPRPACTAGLLQPTDTNSAANIVQLVSKHEGLPSSLGALLHSHSFASPVIVHRCGPGLCIFSFTSHLHLRLFVFFHPYENVDDVTLLDSPRQRVC